MARLPYPDPLSLGEPVRRLLEKLPPANLFRMVSHAQSALRPFVMLGDALLYRSELDPRLRELAILRVGHLSNSPYEVFQHERMAADVGLSAEQVAAARVGPLAPALSATEALVLSLTDEVVLQVRASADTFGRVCQQLPPRQVTELVLTVGYYAMVSRVLETLDIDPEVRQQLPGALPK